MARLQGGGGRGQLLVAQPPLQHPIGQARVAQQRHDGLAQQAGELRPILTPLTSITVFSWLKSRLASL